MAQKTKGQRANTGLVEPLAFSSLGLWAWRGAAPAVWRRGDRGSEPLQVHRLNRPTSGANHSWGTSSGRSRKDGVSRPAVILAYTLEESKGQNDVPQVSKSLQEIR